MDYITTGLVDMKNTATFYISLKQSSFNVRSFHDEMVGVIYLCLFDP